MKNSGKLTQRATALALMGALGVAVFLNWQYASPFQPEKTAVDTQDLVQAAAKAQLDDMAQPAGAQPAPEAVPVMDGLMTQQEALDAADKNYGEAQLVSVAKDSGTEFFEAARLDRTKTRDSVLDALEKRLKKSALSEQEKADTLARLTEHLSLVTLENEAETLIKAKGFADCLCFLRDGKADVTVMTVSGSGLSANQVAQIRDILLGKVPGLQAKDITLVEVK